MVAAAGCGSGSDGPSGPSTAGGGGAAAEQVSAAGTFVGQVEGTDAFISVSVADDGEAVVYVCDGGGLVEYLDGVVADGALAAVEPLGTTVAATVDGDTVSGQVVLADGAVHPFTAGRAAGEAGAFWLERVDEAAGTIVAGGWIRLAGGEVRGKVQTITLGDGGTVTDGSVGVADGTSNTVSPDAEPTGIIKDFRCGRLARKITEMKQQPFDERAEDYDVVFFDLVDRNDALGCPGVA